MRFTKEQTEFEFEYKPVFSASNWLRKGLIGAGLSILVTAFATNAQTTPSKHGTETVAKKAGKKLVFTGKVLFEEEKTPAVNVMVSLTANRIYTTVTDSLGNFKLLVDKAENTDSLFTFDNIACQPLQVKLTPGINQTVYLKKQVYQLDPIVISDDGYERYNYVLGGLPLVNYIIYVKPAHEVPVDMMIRHYFGISFWD